MSNQRSSNVDITEAPTGITQSVARALRILQCFSDATPHLRVSDVSAQLDLTPSLVSRLFATLEYEGFVARDEERGSYRLGPSVLSLAGIALNHDHLRMEALATMQHVAARLSLGVNLSVLDRDAIFYLGHIDAPDQPRAYTLIGRHNPLHSTGMGKVLLAFLPAAERDALIARLTLEPFTVHTISRREDLEAELATVRSSGWALEMEELALGRACIAGPLRDHDGSVVGAISISGSLTTFDWDRRKAELIRAIIEATDRISMQLGYITAPRTAAGDWRSLDGTRARSNAQVIGGASDTSANQVGAAASSGRATEETMSSTTTHAKNGARKDGNHR